MRGVYKPDHKGDIMQRRAIVRRGHKDFGVKGMKKGVHKAVEAVGNAAKNIGKNYRKAAVRNVGLAKKLLKSKNIGHKLTGAYVAATIPFATALGGTALNLKAGYKGAKKAITGKDSAYHDSLIVMAYRKRQLMDAKTAYLKALRRKSVCYTDSSGLVIAKYRYQTAIKRYKDSVKEYINSLLLCY